MKRTLTACLLLTGLVLSLLLAFPTTTFAKETRNMLKNGDFESGNGSWNFWTQDTSKGKSKFIKGGGKDGTAGMKITNESAVASSLGQFANCRQGKTYIMSCDVKTENVDGGSGFCLGLATYDSNGTNLGEQVSSSVFGTTDWQTVTFIFKVTNNPAQVNVGARLWFASGTAYVDNITLKEVVETPAVSTTYNLTLSDTANLHTVNALGCEWDPKLLLQVNRNHGITDEDLDFIKEKIRTLGLQSVRMMFMPDWFEKQNDNDDPFAADPDGFDMDNDEMKCLFAYLKVCDELGVRVTLTWWGAPSGHWLANKDIGDWVGAPNDADEMAENISYLLYYIRETLGYNCVKELIIQNEPSYSFHGDGGAVDFDLYVKCYQTMYKRLNDMGMGDIVLVGADDAQSYGWYYKAVEALRDVCGKFNSHNYAWSYDLPYLDVVSQEFVSARTALAGDTPFFLGEFGDGSGIGAYYAASTETYGRGLYVASLVVNAFKAGAAGASYWPLHDVYYYQGATEPGTGEGDNGGLMGMGLIGYKKDGAWSFRPTYYAYGLLCNYIPFGSQVYDITGENDHIIDTVAAKTPDGRWSLIAVNRSEAEQTVSISTGEAVGTALNRYLFTDGALPTDGSMIAASGRVSPTGGVYTVTVPANSFVVLSSVGMSEQDMQVETGTETETAAEPVTETETGAETADSTSGTATDAVSGGCKSSVAGVAPVPAVLTLVGTGVAACKRKKARKDA